MNLILSLPDGYETRIEDNQIGLSGGQRQRIALARALFGDPVLLVLDEPNSALDQEGSKALNTAIRTMKSEGRAVIIMTHRPGRDLGMRHGCWLWKTARSRRRVRGTRLSNP